MKRHLLFVSRTVTFTDRFLLLERHFPVDIHVMSVYIETGDRITSLNRTLCFNCVIWKDTHAFLLF